MLVPSTLALLRPVLKAASMRRRWARTVAASLMNGASFERGAHRSQSSSCDLVATGRADLRRGGARGHEASSGGGVRDHRLRGGVRRRGGRRAGQLVATSDARGCGVNFQYDAAGRVLTEDHSPCTVDHAVYTTPAQGTCMGYEVCFRYDSADPDATTVTDDLNRGLPGLARARHRGNRADPRR